MGKRPAEAEWQGPVGNGRKPRVVHGCGAFWRGCGGGYSVWCWVPPALITVWVAAYAILPVPTTPYILSERMRLGAVEREWVPIDDIAIHLQRAVVAAEDANFCLALGLRTWPRSAPPSTRAPRAAAPPSVSRRVKNAFLWHGRSWPRKGAGGRDHATDGGRSGPSGGSSRSISTWRSSTKACSAPKPRRAITSAFPAADLTQVQAARLAAVLPAPQARSASQPGPFVRDRAAAILDGVATIRADGRDACFAN